MAKCTFFGMAPVHDPIYGISRSKGFGTVARLTDAKRPTNHATPEASS